MATLEQGEAARNPKDSGTAFAVKKGGRHRSLSVPRPSPNPAPPEAICLLCEYLRMPLG